MVADGVLEKTVLYASGLKPPPSPKPDHKKTDADNLVRKSSFRKTTSQTTDECVKRTLGTSGVTDPLLLEKLDSLNRPITREVRPTRFSNKTNPAPAMESYLDANCGINYGRLLTDEVLAADRLLVEAAKKTMDVAGNFLLY